MPKTPTAATRAQNQKPERPERPHKTLTKSQEEMADLASDLILNGGAHEDVQAVLTALLRHQWRRYRCTGGDDPAKLAQGAQSYAERWEPDHHRSLALRWPEQRPEPEDTDTLPGPKPVTELVRLNIRGSLQDAFEEFMADTQHGIEPAWLLNEILECGNSEGSLTGAIEWALGSLDIYVRVPCEHKKRIEEFVAFLEKDEPKVA